MRAYRSSRHAVTTTAIAIAALIWVGGALWLWNDRVATLQEARNELGRMSISVAEHAHRLLSLSDLFLESVKPIAIDPQPTPNDLALIARLTSLLRQDASLTGLATVDKQHMLHVINGAPSQPPVYVGDRPFVAEAQVGRMVASPPVKSRLSNRWLLPLVHGIDGSVSSISLLMAGVDIPALERHYDTIRHSVGGAITLLRDDGTVLARSPSPSDEERVQTLTGAPLFNTVNWRGERDGHFEGPSPFDGIWRLGAYKRIEPFNIGVVVSLARDAALEPWWRRVRLVLAGSVLVSLAIAVGTCLILRLLTSLQAEALTLENRVHDRTRALKLLLNRREQFLAGVSHELRSPLNAILGFSEALLMGIRGPIPTEQADYLRDIHRSGQHLLALVNDLLDSAAIDAGSLRLDESTFAASDIIEETIRLISQSAQLRNITVTTRIDPPDLTLHGDRRRLLQAVLNLSVNAVKYGRQGGRVEISAEIEPTGDCLLTIADDGEGISPEDLRLALAPYGRVEHHTATNAERSNEGTGLGLPLSIGIVELHDGTLTLHSEPGHGTQAVIRLPSKRVRLAEQPVDTTEPNLPVRAT
ncbi:ATP-binding protein [Magnetospirillum molischianum]|uniref:histidine kinase n=1 Tax=Magnetospirillum molischianum DSM 120 TaxID=1150626 RepID=H8FMX9_MAGML|nr:ATP-binding protein [Magnetospirillum molischianum]CCG39717.1 Putative two-component sensor histidine kinase, classical system [Magnetospirillum molischianum DSM 120]